EETAGLGPGDIVVSTGSPLSVELAPGLLEMIFDGIQRPLEKIKAMTGSNIARGINVTSLDHEKLWEFIPVAQVGDKVVPGDILGTVEETAVITHKILVPLGVSGELTEILTGDHTIVETIAKVRNDAGKLVDVQMLQRWPVRRQRPVQKKLSPDIPMVTGQRVIDTLFPIARGGTAAVPGPFGSGKTVIQHQLAKWSDVDIVVYIGCGERGNEMTDVLYEFPELKDPKTGESIMKRTVLIANTSNMPVAAREASIYTGITLAEYFRDMGYAVAIMADSTSRWAEALREISGRLEEMPAEEGFPAYLPSRLSEFYERAGYMDTLCGTEGSVSIIGAVSPQGADFSEPVTQNTKRFVRCFWALDKSLAYARHYPAINWTTSYSEYMDDLRLWYKENIDPGFVKKRQQLVNLLHEEDKLMEIVKLIGSDVLPDEQKLIIEVCRIIRVGFLQQNAYHKDDTYVSLQKQMKMMDTILYLYDKCKSMVTLGVPISALLETGLMEKVTKMKYDIPNDKPELFEQYRLDIELELAKVPVPELREKEAAR
ncbi:MAG: V-type ATP synthase subunit A, partial [Angelakisella sp.]